MAYEEVARPTFPFHLLIESITFQWSSFKRQAASSEWVSLAEAGATGEAGAPPGAEAGQ